MGNFVIGAILPESPLNGTCGAIFGKILITKRGILPDL